MKLAVVTPLCLAALVLAGCSDPKEASKDNFKVAINQWIESQPSCISVPRSLLSPAQKSEDPFPRYVDASAVTTALAQSHRERELEPFEALVDAGLMVMTQTALEVRTGLMTERVVEVPVRAYDLSADGREALVSRGERTAFSVPSQQLCYGAPTVDEVLQFTEPADRMGVKLSRVSYRYHFKALPAWAKNARMQEAFPQLKRDTAESLEGKAVVVLTNDGWVHEKAARL